MSKDKLTINLSKQLLLSLGLAVLIAIFTVIYFFMCRKGINLSNELKWTKVDFTQVLPSFHPDDVISFHWKSKENEFQFTRNNNSDPWTPEITSQAIQKRLNFLMFAYKENISQPPKERIQLSLGFKDGQVWNGVWGENVFVWTSGPNKGKGVELKDKFESLWFLEGRFAFDKRRLEWCRSEVSSITAPYNNGDHFVVYRNKAQWYREGHKREIISSTIMENWLFKFCDIQVDHFIDPKIIKVSHSSWNELLVTFKSEDYDYIYQLPGTSTFAFKINGAPEIQYLVSKEMFQGLIKLREID